MAQFAVACLDNPAAKNATLELGGPEALSPKEVVRMFEQAGGRPFAVEYVTEEALRAQQAAGTDPFQQSFAGLMRSSARGELIPMEETLRAFPIAMTTVQDYARRTLAA